MTNYNFTPKAKDMSTAMVEAYARAYARLNRATHLCLVHSFKTTKRDEVRAVVLPLTEELAAELLKLDSRSEDPEQGPKLRCRLSHRDFDSLTKRPGAEVYNLGTTEQVTAMRPAEGNNGDAAELRAQYIVGRIDTPHEHGERFDMKPDFYDERGRAIQCKLTNSLSGRMSGGGSVRMRAVALAADVAGVVIE